jgi:hypothetical protein
MITTLILVLVSTCGAGLCWGLRNKGRLYSFPFLATLVYCGWVLPQVFSLMDNKLIPASGFLSFLIMAILSLWMIFAAFYIIGPLGDKLKSFSKDMRSSCFRKEFFGGNAYADKKMQVFCFVLALVGFIFYIKILLLPDVNKAKQWTGIVTVYWFFAVFFRYSLAIALLKYMEKRVKSFFLLAFFSAIPMVWHIIHSGRRGLLIEFCLMIALSLFFVKKIELSRWLFVGVFCTAMMLLPSIGEYRKLTKSGESVLEVNVFHNFTQNYSHKAAWEVKNASYELAAIKYLAAYDYGSFHWNEFIHNYVPAQLVGREFKESLKVREENLWRHMKEKYNFYYHQFHGDGLSGARLKAKNNGDAFPEFSFNGSTSTGFKDAFHSFWYFGCLKFFFISLCMCFFFKRAKEGQFLFQLLYMLLVVASLHSITHHTHYFVGRWPHMLAFLLPGLLWAKMKGVDFKEEAAISEELSEGLD